MRKVIFLGLFLLSTQTFGQTINMQATQFANEAGVIGGTVQACSQDITEFNARVLEAINAITQIPTERQQALTSYVTALSKAQTAQAQTHAINCTEAVQTFNKLPLMQADYKQIVLPKLGETSHAS